MLISRLLKMTGAKARRPRVGNSQCVLFVHESASPRAPPHADRSLCVLSKSKIRLCVEASFRLTMESFGFIVYRFTAQDKRLHDTPLFQFEI
ncbi:hypothetical protein EVAR_45993_1 [Eumeta japonica]|uniref:Uncharacterized protein n=1 Tax=Eumeta variegata TaxID=151549 RepID=A0A4C1XBV2_EUMVA|nr:hypothetical protein EVAR_45993_1 [Eumeta japonica]